VVVALEKRDRTTARSASSPLPASPLTPLKQTYKRHERSREAVELAFDAILKEKMKERQALGFRPPRARGARGGRPGRPTPKKERRSFSGTAFGAAFLDRFGNWIDPSASVITLINDGTIFAVFGLWAAWQVRL
jgi:ATP-dependent HslUV protease ATP-binding subunit HslU